MTIPSHPTLPREQALGLSDKSRQVQVMFDRIAPRYDLLNRLLSMRQDVRWRKALIRALPAAEAFREMDGGKVGPLALADVACGTGDVMITCAKYRQDYGHILGYDISLGMIEHGRQRAECRAVAEQRSRRDSSFRFDFAPASAEQLPLPDASVHALSIAFGLRNVDRRETALREFYRVCKPGGKVLILEFFEADSGLMAKTFDVYFKKILPVIGGLLSDRSAYEYLPKSVASMPSASDFRDMLLSAGFGKVQEKKWLAGATRLFIAEKPLG